MQRKDELEDMVSACISAVTGRKLTACLDDDTQSGERFAQTVRKVKGAGWTILLARIEERAYSKAELLGIKRDIEYRLLCGLGKHKARIAQRIRQYTRGI